MEREPKDDPAVVVSFGVAPTAETRADCIVCTSLDRVAAAAVVVAAVVVVDAAGEPGVVANGDSLARRPAAGEPGTADAAASFRSKASRALLRWFSLNGEGDAMWLTSDAMLLPIGTGGISS